jgi:hypothetical protein
MTSAQLNPRQHPISEETEENLCVLAAALTKLEASYGKPFLIDSGYRTQDEQHRIDPAHPNSAHCEGLALDAGDMDGNLWTWLVDHLDLVIGLELYLESKVYTPSWVHITTRPPASSNRIFIP